MNEPVHPIEEGISKVKKVLRALLILWLFCWVWDTILQKSKEPIKTGNHWSNIDPNKHVTDILYLDYNTRTVTYREYGSGSSNYKDQPPVKYNTVINTPSKVVEIDLTPEEVLEQLNIEYEDVRDYYGDELR